MSREASAPRPGRHAVDLYERMWREETTHDEERHCREVTAEDLSKRPTDLLEVGHVGLAIRDLDSQEHHRTGLGAGRSSNGRGVSECLCNLANHPAVRHLAGRRIGTYDAGEEDGILPLSDEGMREARAPQPFFRFHCSHGQTSFLAPDAVTCSISQAVRYRPREREGKPAPVRWGPPPAGAGVRG